MSPLEQFLGLFKKVSGQGGNYYEKTRGSDVGTIQYFDTTPDLNDWKKLTPDESSITYTDDAIAKSSKTRIEDYFSNVIDQTSFNTEDYKRLRSLFVDLFATFRTKSTLTSQVSDPHSLSNSDLDELFRSFGFNYSTILRGVDENPLEQKVQFFLDLVNLYKIKGTPRSLVEVLQYYGVTEVDIYEFFLKLRESDELYFDGNAVAGTSINPPNLIVPYTNVTVGDPHWLYTESQIKLLNSINKLNLPSKTPYIGVAPKVSLENAETALLQRIVQDQHDLYQGGGTLPLNAEITFYGEVRSFLELYLATIYKFNQLYFVGAENQRFVCYDGSNSNYIEVIEDFNTLSNTIPSSRADQKLKYQQYINTYTRLSVTNFLVNRDTCGIVLNQINPILKESLDLDVDPYETLLSLLSDINRWVRNNLGLGFINFGFVLFGMADFFRELKPVIDFFKPYRTRLLLFEHLLINSRLFNSIIIEDSCSFDAEITNVDFITSNSSPCCTVAGQYIPRPVLVGNVPLPMGITCIDIPLSDIQLSSKYGIGLTLETTDLNPSIISCGVQYKTKDLFRATFSSPIDSTNFSLNWTINSTEDGGEIDLLLGETQKTVTFTTPKSTPNYSVSANLQLTDAIANIYVTKIIDKTINGFTAIFSGPTDESTYKLDWIVNDIVYGEDLIIYGDSTKTVSVPPQADTSYPIIVDIYDTINSENIYSYTINQKTTSSFVINLSDIVDDSPLFYSTLIVSWFIPSTTDSVPPQEICGDDILQTRYTRNNFISPPVGMAWKGFWQKNRVYSVNDGVAIANGKHYYCIVSHLSLAETRPDTGFEWATYWVEYSYFGTANDQTGITFYSRETYDCGSNHDLGAVSDFRKNIFIEIQDTKIDKLKCPPTDSSNVFITNEVLLDYGDIISSVQKIPFGISTVIVNLPEKQNGLYAVSASLQNLDATSTVSVINCAVTVKTANFFIIELSSPTDSNNWSINWSINITEKAGVIPLNSGIKQKRITLPSSQVSANYSVSTIVNCLETYVDIFVTKIIDKTVDGFTVVFSDLIPSNNFNLDWSINDDFYGSESIPNGINKITIPLLSAPDSTNYPVLIDFYDSLDSTSVLYAYVISDKTPNSFTVTFSNTIDSTGSFICWSIPPTDVVESYRQTSGFSHYDELGTSFDCPYTNDIVEILQQIIIQASYILLEDGALMLQEDNFALYLE